MRGDAGAAQPPGDRRLCERDLCGSALCLPHPAQAAARARAGARAGGSVAGAGRAALSPVRGRRDRWAKGRSVARVADSRTAQITGPVATILTELLFSWMSTHVILLLSLLSTNEFCGSAVACSR